MLLSVVFIVLTQRVRHTLGYLHTFLSIVRFIYERVIMFWNISGLSVFEAHCGGVGG